MMLTDVSKFTINVPKDTISEINTPFDGYSLCGPRLLILTDTSTGLAVDYLT